MTAKKLEAGRHTPGPWTVVDWGFARVLKIDTVLGSKIEGDPLAHMSYHSAKNRTRAWADASLMAAAPDLLFACKLALMSDDRAVRMVLQQAIDKAEAIDPKGID
jgi:hypothetical protein